MTPAIAHVSAGTRAGLVRVAPHAAGLALMVIAALIIGRPLGWIGLLAPVGPIVASVALRPCTGDWRWALAFGAVAAALIVGGYALIRLPEAIGFTAMFFPLGLLLFLLGTVNYVAVALSRSLRAWRGQPLDYPWIPDRLALTLGLTPNPQHLQDRQHLQDKEPSHGDG